MPRPDLIPQDDGRTCFTVTTRFTISRDQMSEDRCQMSDGTRSGPDRRRDILEPPSGIRERVLMTPDATSKDAL
jgi:hypothetical protein